MNVDRYITDEAVGAAGIALDGIPVADEDIKAAIAAALPHVLAEMESSDGYSLIPGSALPGILAQHRADVLREYGLRECLCPMPNPDCEHPSCPRDPEVQAIERRMAAEAVADV